MGVRTCMLMISLGIAENKRDERCDKLKSGNPAWGEGPVPKPVTVPFTRAPRGVLAVLSGR